MTNCMEKLRRSAKALKRAFDTGDGDAISRVTQALGPRDLLVHADALHVIARENGFQSWPRLKVALNARVMERDERQRRLMRALFEGQPWAVRTLLEEDAGLAQSSFGLACALYDVAHVRMLLARDPSLATREERARRPMMWLAFSKHFQAEGSEDAMLAVAQALLDAGADANDHFLYNDPHFGDAPLSALYAALGHAGNMLLAEWLLEKGANPNDNESLYRATEFGHPRGVALLLRYGARPEGTNALARALDFDNREIVNLLLEAGANPLEPVSGSDEAVSILHHGVMRRISADTGALLIERGADVHALLHGRVPYVLARIHGLPDLAEVMAQHGGAVDLTPLEAQLVRAADGNIRENDWIDMARVPQDLKSLLTHFANDPAKLPHAERLVAMGFDANETDAQKMPPFHQAAWQGLPEVLDYFLKLGPDLAHLNMYGGNFFSTILHGAQNCPQRAERDHIACMRLALELGVALPRPAIESVQDTEIGDFLADWAEAYPGQVVGTGII